MRRRLRQRSAVRAAPRSQERKRVRVKANDAPLPAANPGTLYYPIARELLGGLADVAMLLPMMAGLVATGTIAGSASLVAVGVTYIAAAAFFRIPMPVQPLKAMAAIALASGATSTEFRLAALAFAGALGAVAATSLRRRLENVPPTVVHATQFSLAALLLTKSLTAVQPSHGVGPVLLVLAAAVLVVLQARREGPVLAGC